MNSYSISFQLHPNANTKISRREFENVVNTFVGESRQYRTDPATSIVYSRPIRIEDIRLQEFAITDSIRVAFKLRCEQGCNVGVFLHSLLDKLNISSSFTMTDESVCRTQHCGMRDNSPLCVDRE